MKLGLSIGASTPRGQGLAWKLAGTGIRLSTGTLTKSGNNFVAVDFAVGMPDHEVSECYFFFPAFACKTPGSGGEVACTSTITIEGMATRSSNGQRTLGVVNGGATTVIDPALSETENGAWVKFVPASPIPAGATQIFSVAQEITDGTYARGRIASNSVDSIFGGTVKDERSQGGATSQLSTLSGSGNYSNVNGGAVTPCAMMVRTPASKPSVFVIGDSKGYGADLTIRNKFMTDRHALGFLDIGLDENIASARVQFNNWCVPGWGFTADATSGSHGNETASARQIWALDRAVAINGGKPIADHILSQHGTNSSASGQTAMLAGYRSMYSIFRSAIGGSASTPVYQLEMDAYPTSTDGYNTLANQAPLNVHQDYPTGGRWLVNEDIGGPDGLGDPTATLRADNSIQNSVALWRISSADLTTQRDLFAVRAFNTTLAEDYGGSGNLSMADAPQVGEYLSFFDGSVLDYKIVEGVSGSGPYTVDLAGSVGALAAADTQIRSTYSGGGLHPGPLYHKEIADDPNDGIVGLKLKIGWTAT